MNTESYKTHQSLFHKNKMDEKMANKHLADDLLGPASVTGYQEPSIPPRRGLPHTPLPPHCLAKQGALHVCVGEMMRPGQLVAARTSVASDQGLRTEMIS